MTNASPRRTFLVTGGGGFVGGAIITRLLQQGHHVRSLARGDYPELAAKGVRCFRADLTQRFEMLTEAFAGVDGVFHTAARIGAWGPYKEFFMGNFMATGQAFVQSRRQGVKAFVYTSTPSVVANGRNLRGVNELQPYPIHHTSYYAATKAATEREILAANGRGGVKIAALRPHFIVGPGDRHLIPLILKRAREGRLIRVGDGKNRTDMCHIDSCAEAHLLAMENLLNAATCAGRAYFISQGDPVPLWPWINAVLAMENLPPVRRAVPRAVGIAAGTFFENLSRIAPFVGDPPFTRYLAEGMATDHYFDISAARRDFGFVPFPRDLWNRETLFGAAPPVKVA